jgi:hypothetical protein
MIAQEKQTGPFNRKWFTKHQGLLLWFVNTPFVSWYMRRILFIEKAGDKKIEKITPNAVFWISKKTTRKTVWQAEFKTDDHYAKQLKASFFLLWLTLHLWDTLVANLFAPQLNVGFDSLNQVSGSDDGDIYVAAQSSFAIARAATTGAVETNMYAQTYGENPTSWYTRRGYLPFDTSALPDDITISAATLDLYPTGKDDNSNETNGDVLINGVTVASPPTLSSGDNDNLLAGSRMHDTSEDKDMTTITLNSTLTWTFNSTGRAFISKTGYTTFGVLSGYDYDNVAPVSGNGGYVLFNTSADAANKPTLNITYTLNSAIKTKNGLAKASIKTAQALAIASVKTAQGLA